MNIRQFRMSKNLTQLQLARMLNVKRTTVSMWEQGKSKPRVSILKKLAIIFDCSIEDLV